MVSKTLMCLAFLAVVAVCSCAPPSSEIRNDKKREYDLEEMRRQNTNGCSNTNSDSNESNPGLCDLNNQKQQKNKKNLQMQDSSSSESSEEQGQKMKVKFSQENKNSMEIRQAPKPQRMNERRNGPDYVNGQKVRENIQKSRNQNNENSNENNSQGYQNQIGKY